MSKRIVDYQIIYDRYEVPLEDSVMEKIKDGWQPLGSPFVYVSSDRTEWGTTEVGSSIGQTMVKYYDIEANLVNGGKTDVKPLGGKLFNEH
jgi:hypothetical protein